MPFESPPIARTPRIIIVGGRRASERRLMNKRREAGELRRTAEEKASRADEREALAEEQAARAEQERTDAEESQRRADEVDPDVKA